MQIQYQLSANTWANACLYYSECGGILNIALKTTKTAAFLFFPLYIIIGLSEGFTIRDTLFCLGLLTWLFARKPLNLALMKYRLKKTNFENNNQFTVQFSRNGIVWKNTNQAETRFTWDALRGVTQVSNGFIIPDKKFRFIFIPLSAFTEDQLTHFNDLLIEHKIQIKSYPEISC